MFSRDINKPILSDKIFQSFSFGSKKDLLKLFLDLFIQEMKDLMNAKLFLKNNMSWCAAYNCSNSSKNNLDKTFFILPKNECTRKEVTLSKNVYLYCDHFERHNYFLNDVPRKENL